MFYNIGVRAVDFEATPTVGSSPLNVQFTSFAFSGVPGGIQNYAWDFDNDGNIDDTSQNPMFTYVNCGTYSVSLTIIDGQGSATETKLDYIATDIVAASFSNTLLGPLTIQFNDTSTGSPTSWAWDLDGNGTIDSNLQNPIMAYPAGCDEVTVSLTVARACQPPVTLTKPIAVATSIESTFQGGLVTVTGALSSANYFDISVANPLGITMCAMHVNSGIGVGGPLTVEIYQTEGTYVGKTGDASLWRLVGSETVSSAGAGNRTFVPFSSPVHFASGAYGICMVHIGASPTYTNLGGMTQVYSTADLTLTAGLSQSEPVFDPLSATFSPRIANVALHYSTSQTNGTAGYGYIGSGCPGTLGVATNTSTTQPVLGGAANIVIDNLPFNLAALVLGVNRLNPPVPLVVIGMPGCSLHTSLDFIATLIGAGNTATFPFAIPNTATLVGAQIYTQAGSFDPGLNGFGFSTSDAAVLLVGQ
jgi:PKD repeat protein